MGRRELATLALVAVAGGAVAVGVYVISAGSDDDVEAGTTPVAVTGRLFAIEDGDPVNVDVRQESGGLCLALSAEPYLTSTYCPPRATVTAGKAFTVAGPIAAGEAPILVVGLLPASRSRAVVVAGEVRAVADTRGTVYLAELTEDALGEDGDVRVTVELD